MAEECEYEVTLVRRVTVKAKVRAPDRKTVRDMIAEVGAHEFQLSNGEIHEDDTMISKIEEVKG